MKFDYLKNFNKSIDEISIDELNKLLNNKDKITDDLLGIVDYTVKNTEKISEESTYSLHILAMYLLAYFKEKRAYTKFIEIFKLPSINVRDLFGDRTRESLANIIASVFDGDLLPIQELVESEQCDVLVRETALKTLVTLVANDIIKRDELVIYFKELFNDKRYLLNVEVIECLINSSIEIHPDGLQEDIRNANDGDVLGYYSPEIDMWVEEKEERCVECILKELRESCKEYSEYRLICKEDVMELSKWLGKRDYYEDFDSLHNEYELFNDDDVSDLLDYEDEDYNTTVVRDEPKVGRNEPCPCGSGEKYKKCCGM